MFLLLTQQKKRRRRRKKKEIIKFLTLYFFILIERSRIIHTGIIYFRISDTQSNLYKAAEFGGGGDSAVKEYLQEISVFFLYRNTVLTIYAKNNVLLLEGFVNQILNNCVF